MKNLQPKRKTKSNFCYLRNILPYHKIFNEQSSPQTTCIMEIISLLFVFWTFDLLSTIGSTEAKHLYMWFTIDSTSFSLFTLPFWLIDVTSNGKGKLNEPSRSYSFHPKNIPIPSSIFIRPNQIVNFNWKWLILVIHHCWRINLDKKFTIRWRGLS